MKTLEKHEKYMLRCIYLARNNESKYYPNPSVGSIIVKDNIIISEGTTSNYGENHAEVNAINNVKNKNDLKGATLYVTLEPCSHYGKTPPLPQSTRPIKTPLTSSNYSIIKINYI